MIDFVRAMSVSTVFLLAVVFFLAVTPVSADVVEGTDASVWDSNVAASTILDPVGGSGQLNGEFVVDTLDQGASAIQVGLRAQERFQGPTWTRIGNIYFATAGESTPGLATWNIDWHLDFGTSEADTGVSASLETTLGKTLADLNMRDFTVTLQIDTDPTIGTTFEPLDMNTTVSEKMIDVRLSQESTNLGFFGIETFDPNVTASHDFVLTVQDPNTSETLAEVAIEVRICGASDPTDICVLFSDGFESGDTTSWTAVP